MSGDRPLQSEADFFIACSFSVPLIVAVAAGFLSLLLVGVGFAIEKSLLYLFDSLANVEYISLLQEYSRKTGALLYMWGLMCFFSLLFYPIYLILAVISVPIYKKGSTKIRMLWSICLPLVMAAPFMWWGGRFIFELDVSTAILIVGYTNVVFFLMLLHGAKKSNHFSKVSEM